MMTAKDEERVLRRLLERVRTTHWIKGKYHKRVGNKRCYCLVGHVNVLTGTPPSQGSSVIVSHEDSLRHRVLAHLRRATRTPDDSDLESWNHLDGRKRQAVERMLVGLLGD